MGVKCLVLCWHRVSANAGQCDHHCSHWGSLTLSFSPSLSSLAMWSYQRNLLFPDCSVLCFSSLFSVMGSFWQLFFVPVAGLFMCEILSGSVWFIHLLPTGLCTFPSVSLAWSHTGRQSSRPRVDFWYCQAPEPGGSAQSAWLGSSWPSFSLAEVLWFTSSPFKVVSDLYVFWESFFFKIFFYLLG